MPEKPTLAEIKDMFGGVKVGTPVLYDYRYRGQRGTVDGSYCDVILYEGVEYLTRNSPEKPERIMGDCIEIQGSYGWRFMLNQQGRGYAAAKEIYVSELDLRRHPIGDFMPKIGLAEVVETLEGFGISEQNIKMVRRGAIYEVKLEQEVRRIA